MAARCEDTPALVWSAVAPVCRFHTAHASLRAFCVVAFEHKKVPSTGARDSVRLARTADNPSNEI